MTKKIDKQEKLRLLIKERDALLDEAKEKDEKLWKGEDKAVMQFVNKHKKEYTEVNNLYKKEQKLYSGISKLKNELAKTVCTKCGHQLD